MCSRKTKLACFDELQEGGSWTEHDGGIKWFPSLLKPL